MKILGALSSLGFVLSFLVHVLSFSQFGLPSSSLLSTALAIGSFVAFIAFFLLLFHGPADHEVGLARLKRGFAWLWFLPLILFVYLCILAVTSAKPIQTASDHIILHPFSAMWLLLYSFPFVFFVNSIIDHHATIPIASTAQRVVPPRAMLTRLGGTTILFGAMLTLTPLGTAFIWRDALDVLSELPFELVPPYSPIRFIMRYLFSISLLMAPLGMLLLFVGAALLRRRSWSIPMLSTLTRVAIYICMILAILYLAVIIKLAQPWGVFIHLIGALTFSAASYHLWRFSRTLHDKNMAGLFHA